MGINIKRIKYHKNWIVIPLNDFCNKITDGTHFTPKYFSNGVPFISVKDIYNDKVHFNDCKYIRETDHNELIKRCKPEKDDILITKSGTIGRMALVPSKPEFSLFVSVALIKNNKKFIISNFLKYCLENYLNTISIAQDIKGGVLKNFHLEDIRKTDVPVVPLPEQRAIVAKIEQLFSELDSGVENLKKAQAQLKVYRQAVLKWAFEGKLTEEWRKKQKNLPTAETLLAQIKAEREKHAEKSNKKLKPIPPISKEELAELPKLPEGWVYGKLREIAIEVSDGDHQPPPKTARGIPFITISNILSNNKIDFSNTFYVSEKYYNGLKKTRMPFKGDILYTVTGSFGIPVLIDFEKAFCFQRHIGLIRPSKSLNQKWLYFLLQSPQVFNQAKEVATGTAQKTVSLEGLRNFILLIVSNEEQQQIVQEIEDRLSVCDKMEETITQTLQKTDSLRQSILKKAFEGKLLTNTELEEVRNTPDWEPAEKLLQRIKTEKESQKIE